MSLPPDLAALGDELHAAIRRAVLRRRRLRRGLGTAVASVVAVLATAAIGMSSRDAGSDTRPAAVPGGTELTSLVQLDARGRECPPPSGVVLVGCTPRAYSTDARPY